MMISRFLLSTACFMLAACATSGPAREPAAVSPDALEQPMLERYYDSSPDTAPSEADWPHFDQFKTKPVVCRLTNGVLDQRSAIDAYTRNGRDWFLSYGIQSCHFIRGEHEQAVQSFLKHYYETLPIVMAKEISQEQYRELRRFRLICETPEKRFITSTVMAAYEIQYIPRTKYRLRMPCRSVSDDASLRAGLSAVQFSEQNPPEVNTEPKR